jgi:hypothetical protein
MTKSKQEQPILERQLLGSFFSIVKTLDNPTPKNANVISSPLKERKKMSDTSSCRQKKRIR